MVHTKPTPFTERAFSPHVRHHSYSGPQIPGHDHPYDEPALSEIASLSNTSTSSDELSWYERLLRRRHRIILWASAVIFEVGLILVTTSIVFACVHGRQYGQHNAAKMALIVLGVCGFVAMVSSAAVAWLVCQWRKDRGSRWALRETTKERTRMEEIQRANELLKALRERQMLLQHMNEERNAPSGERIPSFRSMTPSSTPSPTDRFTKQRNSSWTHHLDLADDEALEKETGVVERTLQGQRSIDELSRDILARMSPSASPQPVKKEGGMTPIPEQSTSASFSCPGPSGTGDRTSTPLQDIRRTHRRLSPMEKLYGLAATPPPDRPLPNLPNGERSTLGITPPNNGPAPAQAPVAAPQAEIHPAHQLPLRIPPEPGSTESLKSPVTIVHRSPIEGPGSPDLQNPSPIPTTTTITTKPSSSNQPPSYGKWSLFPSSESACHTLPTSHSSPSSTLTKPSPDIPFPPLAPIPPLFHKPATPPSSSSSSSTSSTTTTTNKKHDHQAPTTNRPPSSTQPSPPHSQPRSETSSLQDLRTAKSLERVREWHKRSEDQIRRDYLETAADADALTPRAFGTIRDVPSFPVLVVDDDGEEGVGRNVNARQREIGMERERGGGDKMPIPQPRPPLLSRFSSSEHDGSLSPGNMAEQRKKIGESVRGLALRVRGRKGDGGERAEGKGKGVGIGGLFGRKSVGGGWL